MIGLAKQGNSSDNISIIAVFLKDAKEIIYEYDKRTMDFESNTNGCHELAADDVVNMNSPSSDSHLMGDVDEYKVHVELKQPSLVDQESHVHHSEFFFSNGNGNGNITAIENGDFMSTADTISASGETASNADANSIHEKSDGEASHHDDFGPETDVDATDDAAISPLSPLDQAAGFMSSNENVDDKFSHEFIEHAVIEQHVEHASIDDEIKKDEDAPIDIGTNDFQHRQFIEDNRFVDNEVAHLDVHSPIENAPRNESDDDDDDEDDEIELQNKIDFSEKKEYSFEREHFEKELDATDDLTSEILVAISKEVAVAAAYDEKERDEEDDDDDDDDMNADERHEIITTAEQHGEYFDFGVMF